MTINLFALSHPNSGGVSQIMFCICYVMAQERLCKYPALHELEVCQGVDFGFAYKTKDVMTDVPPEPTVEPFTFEDWDKKCGLLSPHENWTLIATQTVLYVFCYSNVKVCLSTRMRPYE